jgi:hypothetical protein
MNRASERPNMLSRRQMLRTAGLCLSPMIVGSTRLRAAQRARPNVVIILADDQGWGDLSIHGNTNLSTPNIDSIAREGALFDRFYVRARSFSPGDTTRAAASVGFQPGLSA